MPAVPSAAAWAAFADQTAELLVLLDAMGRIIWANRAFERACACDIAQLLGETLQDRLGTGDAAWATIAEALSQGRAVEPIELAWRGAGSEARWGRFSAQPLGDGTAGVAARLQDLSEQHRLVAEVQRLTETSRQASELAQRLQIATEAAGIGIFNRDVQTERAEWNAEMFRITGRAPELGAPTREEWLNEFVHPDDRPMMRTVRDRLLGSPHDTGEDQYRIVRPDGEVRWLVNRARRVTRGGRPMVSGVTIDVTDRVRTEAALRSANERVALTARSLGLGTWEWDPATGAARWDDAMYRLRGREPQSGAPSIAERMAMTHPADRHIIKSSLSQAAHEGQSSSYEFRVIWPDGSVRWLASRAMPVFDADGRNMRYIGVNWDITDSVNAENERREKIVAQRESEAKSQFLSRMSHELRTPLNAVLGFAQLLQCDGGLASAEQRARVDHIRTAGEHLLMLINDVLDLSSLQTGQVTFVAQAVPMAELVAEALPLLATMAQGAGVTLHTQLSDAVAWADPTRVRQVLINLLSNAIKYNRALGQVFVQTQTLEHQVVLRVRDTGRGMSAEQRDHLFEPFNRLGIDREGIQGTGIGLTIVKALVDRMGGSISVRSEPGVGSTFEVMLPRAAGVGGATPAAREPRPTLQRLERSGQLLYIEDNPVNVVVLEQLVASRTGLAIACEPTGELGVARARTLRPDVIVVDMQLPDLDGMEVLRRLRAQPETADTPCIVLSANAMPEDVARALKAGFAAYWTKPISFDTFLAALDALLPPRA